MSINRPKNIVPSKICFNTILIFFATVLDDRILKHNSTVIHDGPPYANGDLHIGHLFNRTIKDLIARSTELKDENIIYIPGWDCHGLPIENKAIENLKLSDKLNKNNISKIRNESDKITDYYIERQKQQIINFLCDIDKTRFYTTKSIDYQIYSIEVLFKLIQKDIVKVCYHPVYYSFEESTNLAIAEIEYEDIPYISTYFIVDIDNSNIKIAIWTTQSWTISGNEILCINKNGKYFINTINGQDIIFEETFIDNNNKKENNKLDLHKKHPIDNHWILMQKYSIPEFNIYSRDIKISSHVNLNEGTGILHIAPAHGFEDYSIYKSNFSISNIKNCVDMNGYLTHPLLKEYKIGIEGSKKTIEILQKNNKIIFTEESIHRNTVSWRSKKQVYIISTLQVAIDIDLETMRSTCYGISGKFKIYAQNINSLVQSIMSRPNLWCISRQRSWGTPIMIIIDKTSNRIIQSDKINNFIIQEIKNRNDTSFWLDEDFQNSILNKFSLSPSKYQIITDTLDVWYESGISIQYIKSKDYIPKKSTILICEGKDQNRGWFQSLILLINLLNLDIKINKIYIHGFICNSKGQKISKSDKESVYLVDHILKNAHPEVIRLMFAIQNYQEDVIISQSLLTYAQHMFIKIYNTLRYFINIKPEESNNIKADNTKISIIDKYYRNIVKNYFESYSRNIKNGHFSLAYKNAGEIIYDMSDFLSISKDMLYCDNVNTLEYQNTIETIRIFFIACSYMYYPIMPATISYLVSFCLSSNDKNKRSCITDYIKEINSIVQEINYSDNEFTYIKVAHSIKDHLNVIVDHIKKIKEIGSNYELGIIYQTNTYIEDNKLFENVCERILDISHMIKDDNLHINFNILDEKIIKSKFNIKIYIVDLKHKYTKCIRCWKYYSITLDNKMCKRCYDIEKI